jgi:hypothetical protein
MIKEPLILKINPWEHATVLAQRERTAIVTWLSLPGASAFSRSLAAAGC